MSTTSAYRLERPRSSIPPPLQLQKAPAIASPSSPTFSYSEPVSPPVSARSLLPSSSSTSNHRRDRSSIYAAGRSRRATPPPNDASSKEMLRFATLCHEWYYEQDEEAGRSVTQIMQSVPDSLRAPYIKLQASIRSAYHASVSSRRIAEFNAQLSSTFPGGSLSPAARSDVHGKVAMTERREQFASFVKTWCNESMPGPKPFFEGLWAVMRLMTLPENIGGAGSRRIEWEIDDAVFRETAGKDFMLDAITTMKGILGFSDRPLPDSQSNAPSMTDLLEGDPPPLSPTQQRILPQRVRDSSDPFTDDLSEPPTSHPPQTYANDQTTELSPAKTPPPALLSPAKSPTTLSFFNTMMQTNSTHHALDRLEEPQLRVWLTPDLSNSEYTTLSSLFPSSVTGRTFPRFRPSTQSLQGRRKEHDLEEDFGDEEDERGQVKCGTGRMWIGDQERTGLWKGGWWSRLVGWLRSTFC